MGLEIGTAIALAGVLASAAGTGAAIYNGIESKNEAAAAGRAQARDARKRQTELENAQAANDATAAARMARMRQRASIASNQGYDQTIATSPLGLASTQSGGATGPQPLKKLGA
jgi:hypothetical protein